MTHRRYDTTGRIFRATWLPLLVGLCLSQIVATLFVYRSNQKLWAMAQAVESQGYLSIPTGPALQTLTQFGSAFWGGLFFTLSIGTGLTLAAWAAIRLWDQLFGRNRRLIIAYVAAWMCIIIWMNISGFAWMPFIFCLLVPPAVGWITAMGLGPAKSPSNRLWAVPCITLAILTALWATQFNTDIFVSIRDHILLSNPVGQKVNDFYYRYTLYAATVFKSFNQKTIRTVQWDSEADTSEQERIEKRMLRHDVLLLKDAETSDITLALRQGKLWMISAAGRRLETTPAQFLADTPAWLSQYSQRNDRLASFRRMTLLGLLIGFPVLLFVVVYSGLLTIAVLLLKEKKANMTASAICMLIGILLFLPMRNVKPMEITDENITFAMEADSWPMRVAALRYIERNKIDISRYPQYRSLLKSPLIVERYWMARAMAASRTISTHTQLTALMKDSHPNVVCQAYYALGQRRSPGAIQPIYRHLKTSDHWYSQWYGYRAIRRLGWQQKKSK